MENFYLSFTFQMMAKSSSSRVKGGPTNVGFSSEGDRDMAMRQMRFQGHLRRPTKNSKATKSGNSGPDLASGWAHKKADFYDEK